MRRLISCILGFDLLTVCAVESAPQPRGICLSLCGPYGVECPSGYECRGNGCGHECYRPANYVVPEGRWVGQGCTVTHDEDKQSLGLSTDDINVLNHKLNSTLKRNYKASMQKSCMEGKRPILVVNELVDTSSV